MNAFTMSGWYANEYGEMEEATVLIDDAPYTEPQPFAPEPTEDIECPW